MKNLIVILSCVLVFGIVNSSQAVPINDSYVFQNVNVIDFSEFRSYGLNTITSPIQVGSPNGHNIIWSSTTYRSSIGNGIQGLIQNGWWDYQMEGYASLTVEHGTMKFLFDQELTSVGGYINHIRHPSYETTTISSLDINGNIIESLLLNIHIIPECSPNLGEFWGFKSDLGGIYGFSLSNGMAVLDNLTYSYAPAPVPEPSTLLLFGTGLAGLITLKRKKEKLEGESQ